MTDYKKLYHLLFNEITDALEALDHQDIPEAVGVLKHAQIKAEELVLGDE